MRTEIKELHQRLGITTVQVTQDQVEAMTMADRIAVMRDGIVEQVGRPLELYDEPANLIVAGFIGSPAMNLLTGHLERSDGRLIFRTDKGATLPYSADGNNNLVGRSLVLGIRPENISLASDGAEGTVDVRVGVVEPMGAETIVAMHLGEEALFGSFRERISIGANCDLRLRIDRHKSLLFDAASEERLPSTHS